MRFRAQALVASAFILTAVAAHATDLQTWRATSWDGDTLDLVVDLDAAMTTSVVLGSHSFAQAIQSVSFEGQTFAPVAQATSGGVPGLSFPSISVGVPSGIYSAQLMGLSLTVNPANGLLPSASSPSLADLLASLSARAAAGELQMGLSYPDPNPFVVNGTITQTVAVTSFAPLTAVPEPASWQLMALGLGAVTALAALNRQRR